MATRIPWRGSVANHLQVGPDKRYEYSGLQAALDAIAAAADAALDNRYVVTVAPGYYVSTDAILDNVPFTDVAAEVPGTAVLYRSAAGNGGTVRIGDHSDGGWTEVVQDKLYSGLRIVRDFVGSVMTAPEAALFVGGEYDHPGVVPWTNIWIHGCEIVGGHDALQAFGTNPNDYPSGAVPRLLFQASRALCMCDAVTLKGDALFISQGNYVHTHPVAGALSPYLDPPAAAWKQTGFHVNAYTDSTADIDARNPDARFISSGDVVVVDGYAGEHAGPSFPFIAGYLFYSNSAGPYESLLLPCRVVDPTIRVRGTYVTGTGVVTKLAGVAVTGAYLKNTDGQLLVRGADIDVEAVTDSAYLPDDVAGVSVDTGLLTTARVVDSSVDVRTNKGGGTAHSLLTEAANARIKFRNVTSDQLADDSAGGDITELTTVAVP